MDSHIYQKLLADADMFEVLESELRYIDIRLSSHGAPSIEETAIPPSEIQYRLLASFLSSVSQHIALGGLRTTVKAKDGSSIAASVYGSEHNWPWMFALAAMYNASRRETCCLCIGLRHEEQAELIKYLRAAPLLAAHELLLPIALLDLTCQQLSQSVETIASRLGIVQKDTGLHGGGRDEQRNLPTEKLNSVIRRLTAICDDCARLISRTETLQRMLGPIEGTLGNRIDDNMPGVEVLRERLDASKQTISGSQHYIKWLDGSTQTILQTIYQLTNQSENEINIGIARQAREDSANMLVITFITLAFLPGTFVATLFSTTFFNFQASSGPKTVSAWIWLYFVTTVCCTALVFGVWRYLVARPGRRFSSAEEAVMVEKKTA